MHLKAPIDIVDGGFSGASHHRNTVYQHILFSKNKKMLMRDEEEIIFHTVRLPKSCRAAVVLGLHDELFQCDIRLPYHHFERSEKSLLFAACDSRFPHMCRELLHFPHLSFLPPVPYPPLRGTFPSRGRLFISSGEAATTALKFESRDWVYETLPH